MTNRVDYPALAAWRRRDGNKPASQWRHDDLWRTAMSEMSAREAAALGQHDGRPVRRFPVSRGHNGVGGVPFIFRKVRMGIGTHSEVSSTPEVR